MSRESERRSNETHKQTRDDLAALFAFVDGRRASKKTVLACRVALCQFRTPAALHDLVTAIEETGVVPFTLECVLFRLMRAPELLAHEDSWHPLWR